MDKNEKKQIKEFCNFLYCYGTDSGDTLLYKICKEYEKGSIVEYLLKNDNFLTEEILKDKYELDKIIKIVRENKEDNKLYVYNDTENIKNFFNDYKNIIKDIREGKIMENNYLTKAREFFFSKSSELKKISIFLYRSYNNENHDDLFMEMFMFLDNEFLKVKPIGKKIKTFNKELIHMSHIKDKVLSQNIIDYSYDDMKEIEDKNFSLTLNWKDIDFLITSGIFYKKDLEIIKKIDRKIKDCVNLSKKEKNFIYEKLFNYLEI